MKKALYSLVVASALLVPVNNVVNAQEVTLTSTTLATESGVNITDSYIADTVKDIVAEHGPLTEPLVVDTGIIDNKDGLQISLYIIPDNYASSEMVRSVDITPYSATLLSGHTILQGHKMIYSKSDGNPWTVAVGTTLHFSFYNSESSATSMKYGYLDATTNTEQSTVTSSGTWDGTYRNYGIGTPSTKTSVRFFITNNSANDVYINGGQISF